MRKRERLPSGLFLGDDESGDRVRRRATVGCGPRKGMNGKVLKTAKAISSAVRKFYKAIWGPDLYHRLRFSLSAINIY